MSKRDPGFFNIHDCIGPAKKEKKPFPVVKMLLATTVIIYLLILVKWIV